MADSGKAKNLRLKTSAKVRRIRRQKLWSKEEREIEDLGGRCKSLDSSHVVTKFPDLPISQRTLHGLRSTGYQIPTEIQRAGIPVALRGSDVLGAAKTGSGKTLAFLIPVLEVLWRDHWTSVDGLGALIISPTRELAYQTFEVLCKIGCKHDISAGLIIGGKDLKHEQERIRKTNIVVCTPGRLLQHMDETPDFTCNSLRILVLDEADRILDLGFAAALNAIIENLPEERQTILYSATQTRSVEDLARLSLQDPEYIAVHENSSTSTPEGLKQSYVVCELPEKLNFLYSFIRNHLKSKILVFLSSCKQVKFIYECFCRLRPGVSLMALYGKQKQLKRIAIYDDFCKKTEAVLFATDIAARGLDIPAVHWVIQLDCPEDANTYIHRAGRTARYHKNGQSLLVLLPSEEPEMIKALEDKKIPINKIRVNPKKLNSVQKKLETFCAQDQDIKLWAQKSIVSYARSVFLQSNKKIFDVSKLPLDEFAQSLGLPNPPRIRFLKTSAFFTYGFNQQISYTTQENMANEYDKKAEKKYGKLDGNSQRQDTSSTDGEPGDEETNAEERLARDSAGKRDTSELGDLLVLRKRHVGFDSSSVSDKGEHGAYNEKPKRLKSKVAVAKKLLNKNVKANSKIVFDDDGKPVQIEGAPLPRGPQLSTDALEPVPIDQQANRVVGGISMTESRDLLREADLIDRKVERQRIKEKHKERRLKIKKRRREEQSVASVSLSEGTRDEAEEAEEDEELQQRSKKRWSPERAFGSSEGERPEETSLVEDEELALQLLTSF